jgi:prepilin-type N-terminal cleavage/methylation domain-containing protein
MTNSSSSHNHHQSGFTLVELTIVLIITTLLLGGLMMTLSAQREATASSETQRRLNEARDAILGFAAANGRLPCPANSGSGLTGIESPVGGSNCSNPWNGFLPAVTLGLTPTNENGYALDGWGNPIRYAVTTYTNSTYCLTPVFATTNCLKAAWNGGASLGPDLRICNTASCATGTELANNAVAVIFSQGKNGASAPTSSDEIANSDNDRVFVSHTLTSAGPNEFDDLVTWISPNILYSRLIAAGRLP